MPLRKYPWKSTADAWGAASAYSTAPITISFFLILTCFPSCWFFCCETCLSGSPSFPDHLQRGHLLGRPVRVAFVRQHLVLLFDLALVARSLAGENVDHVRVAIAVGAAAEAMLPFVLVHLPGEQIGLVRKAFVGLHDDLVAPLGDVSLTERLLVDRPRDRAALADGLFRNDDVVLHVTRLLLRLGPHPTRGLGREDH